jgi:hypothetical protein
MGPMKHSAHQTLYDILGIPCGVGVDHIKDSYRLLTKKTPLTDGAYAVLSDPVEKQRYDAELWAAARIKRRSEPVWHESNAPLTPEQERLLKDWGKSKPWRVELPDGTTIRSEDCVAGNPNLMVHEYESCNNRDHDEGHSHCPFGTHFYSNDNKMWYTAIGLPYSKVDSHRGDIQWHDHWSSPEAEEWLRTVKEGFLRLQNPTIGYQCGICSDSDACGGGFTLFWISGSDHALLLRDESDDMFWSMLDKNYLTQEELRLALLRWWPALEDRDDVDLGEIEMVDERLVTPSALLSYPETRVIYLP